MNELPALDVTMYLNISDNSNDPESLVVQRYAKTFKSKHWPTGSRPPKVYYDPRAIDPDRSKRASLHAKCIVVDGEEVFVSSANFTERAQHRNVEVGVRISSAKIALQLTNHFAKLAEEKLLKLAF